MSKLYIFAIGGTGARVLRSFTYLLASGVTLKNGNGIVKYDEVVPYIIDPDLRCGNTKDTLSLLEEYKNIHKSAYFKGIEQKYVPYPAFEYFFRTKMTNKCSNGYFGMDVPGEGTAEKFKDYMRFFYDSSYSSNDKALVQLLFSKDNLNAMMDVGFKGNPNLGSVVMNTIGDSKDFQKIEEDFKEDDGIFVIGSIFGGTGASGFPLLIRKIRQSKNTYLKESFIGAITVMPYFEAEGFKDRDAENKLDTTTFFQKTKAALKYYKDNLKETEEGIPYINHHYYIGDPLPQKNKNSDGGENQRNDACLVELISALSIFHFAKQSRDDEEENKTIYHEYSLIADKKEDEINFSLAEGKFIKKSMTKFLMLENFAKQFMPKIDYSKPWAKEYKHFTDDEKIKKICSFLAGYKKWLKELAAENPDSLRSGRKFNPFNLDTDEKHVFELIKEIKPKKHYFWEDQNYVLFVNRLNKNISISDNFGGKNPDSWFINLFSVVTEELYNSEINKNK